MSDPYPYNIAHHSPEGDVLVGIDNNGPPPPEEYVHLGASNNVWTIALDGNTASITIGKYPASGLSGLQPPEYVVVLDGGPTVVKQWYVYPAPDAPEGYSTIAPDTDPSKVWTVESPNDPKSKIVLGNKGEGSTPSQWFKLLQA